MSVRTLLRALPASLLVGALLLNAGPAMARPDPARTEDRNTRAVERFIDLVNRGDLQRLPSVVAGDYVDNRAGQPDGVKATQAYFAELRRAFTDFHIDIQDNIGVLADEDLVAIRVRVSGVHTGDYRGIPATRKQITASSINLYRVERGKLAEHWEVADDLGFLDQLGVLKDPFPQTERPGTPAGTGARNQTTTEEQNAAIVRELYDAWNDAEYDRLDAVVDPGYLQNNGLGDGLAALKPFFAEYRSAFPAGRNDIQQLVADGDKVMVRVRVTGQQTAPFLGIPNRGGYADYETMDIFRIENGKIIEHWDTVDKLTLFRQIGLLPPA